MSVVSQRQIVDPSKDQNWNIWRTSWNTDNYFLFIRNKTQTLEHKLSIYGWKNMLYLFSDKICWGSTLLHAFTETICNREVKGQRRLSRANLDGPKQGLSIQRSHSQPNDHQYGINSNLHAFQSAVTTVFEFKQPLIASFLQPLV